MGIPVLVLGESGSGKSTSMRNFTPKELSIFNVAGKPLPFRQKSGIIPTMQNATYKGIYEGLANPTKKRYVVDDSQYLMAFAYFGGIKGYDGYTKVATDFSNLIRYVICNLPDDCIVYFLHHTETAYDADGNKKIKGKTIGKALDNHLTLEGLFSIVLMADTDSDGNHFFWTASNGTSTVKTPMEMFEDIRIDNDLKLVDTTIREYYGFGGTE